MTRLTPARRALLQKLSEAGGSISWARLSTNECRTATIGERDGHFKWMAGNGAKALTITDAGRAALTELPP